MATTAADLTSGHEPAIDLGIGPHFSGLRAEP